MLLVWQLNLGGGAPATVNVGNLCLSDVELGSCTVSDSPLYGDVTISEVPENCE